MNPSDILQVPTSLDVVIAIEYFLLGGMTLLFVFFGWSFLDARRARERIYEEIKAQGESLSRQIKEQGEASRAELKSHEEGCSERWREDALWKGRVEGRLDNKDRKGADS